MGLRAKCRSKGRVYTFHILVDLVYLVYIVDLVCLVSLVNLALPHSLIGLLSVSSVLQ